MRPKTKYTQNPCPSIVMNTGLGSRQTFVTEKVGYSTGQEPVEVGEDPDGAPPPPATSRHLLYIGRRAQRQYIHTSRSRRADAFASCHIADVVLPTPLLCCVTVYGA